MQRAIIELSGNLRFGLASMRYLAARLFPLTMLAAGDQALIDMRSVRYLDPAGSAFVRASASEAAARKVTVELTLPTRERVLFGFELLRRFVESRHDDVDPVIALMARHGKHSDDLAESLAIAV